MQLCGGTIVQLQSEDSFPVGRLHAHRLMDFLELELADLLPQLYQLWLFFHLQLDVLFCLDGDRSTF